MKSSRRGFRSPSEEGASWGAIVERGRAERGRRGDGYLGVDLRRRVRSRQKEEEEDQTGQGRHLRRCLGEMRERRKMSRRVPGTENEGAMRPAIARSTLSTVSRTSNGFTGHRGLGECTFILIVGSVVRLGTHEMI